MKVSKRTSGYEAARRVATSRKRPSVAGSMLCLVAHVSLPGRPTAGGGAEERRVRGVDGAAGRVVVLHRRTHPVDGEAEAVHERDRGAHRLGRGVLALDDDHALATAHRRLPAAGSLAASTRSTLPPRIFSMSRGA